MTCSAWSVWVQFLFQEEQRSFKIKLNANKRKTIFLYKEVWERSVILQPQSFLDVWTYLWPAQGSWLQGFASPELGAERFPLTSLFCSAFSEECTKLLKDVCSHSWTSAPFVPSRDNYTAVSHKHVVDLRIKLDLRPKRNLQFTENLQKWRHKLSHVASDGWVSSPLSLLITWN